MFDESNTINIIFTWRYKARAVEGVFFGNIH